MTVICWRIGSSGCIILHYDEAQNFIVVVEDNWGNITEMEFDFNNAGDEETDAVEDSLSVQEGGAL